MSLSETHESFACTAISRGRRFKQKSSKTIFSLFIIMTYSHKIERLRDFVLSDPLLIKGYVLLHVYICAIIQTVCELDNRYNYTDSSLMG